MLSRGRPTPTVISLFLAAFLLTVSVSNAAPPRGSPDLIVSGITAPSSAAAGASISLIYTVKNIGQWNAKGSTVACSLTGPSGTKVLGSASIKALADGASYTGSMNVTVPANFTAGTYTLAMTADSTNAVSESNETNDTATRSLLITNSSPVTGDAFLSWNANPEPDIAGYRVYRGTASGTYSRVSSVGDVTAYTESNLPAGSTYFFVVTALDIEGQESAFSSEVSKTISY